MRLEAEEAGLVISFFSARYILCRDSAFNWEGPVFSELSPTVFLSLEIVG